MGAGTRSTRYCAAPSRRCPTSTSRCGSVGEGRAAAVVEVGVQPLMQLVWWGGLLVVAGLAQTLLQSSRRVGTTVTRKGDDAVNGCSPVADVSSTYTPSSSRSAVTLGTSGSTIQ